MLRMLGVTGLHPLALLAAGAILLGVGLWQHLALLALAGVYVLVRSALGAVSAHRSGAA